MDRIDAEHSTPMRALPHNYTFVEPDSAMMRQVPVFSTTCSRWVTVLTACKTRRVSLLGTLTNVFLGIFLTALVPAISDYSTQKTLTVTPWILVALIFAVATAITSAAYWQDGSSESASIASVLGELQELIKRFDAADRA